MRLPHFHFRNPFHNPFRRCPAEAGNTDVTRGPDPVDVQGRTLRAIMPMPMGSLRVQFLRQDPGNAPPESPQPPHPS